MLTSLARVKKWIVILGIVFLYIISTIVYTNSRLLIPKMREVNNDMPANFQSIRDILPTIDCNDSSSYNGIATQNQALSFLSEDAILQRTADCDSYFKNMDIFGQELSTSRLKLTSGIPELRHSPLAFSHSIHKQAGILEVHLALTFRPGDSHCFHIDQKARLKTTKAMESIISCYNQKFPNTTMFSVPRPVPVYWGHFSVLEVCEV